MVSRKSWFISILLVCTIMMFAVGSPSAWANSAPLKSPPEVQAALVPAEDSPIQVDEEHLQFIVNDSGMLSSATVQVHYRMSNPTNEPQQLSVAFPFRTKATASGLTGFQVNVNGQPLLQDSMVEVTDSRRYDAFLKRYGVYQVAMVDPETGEVDPEWEKMDTNGIRVFTFPLSFAAYSSSDITVTYDMLPGVDRKRYIEPVKVYQYLLLPASAWKQFGKLTVQVAVPNTSKLRMSLPGARQVSAHDAYYFPLPDNVRSNAGQWQIWRAESDGLPKSNLSFSVMAGERLLFDKANRGFYDGIVMISLFLFCSLFALLLAFLLTRSKAWWLRWIIGIVAAPLTGLVISIASGAMLISAYPIFGNTTWLSSFGWILTIAFGFIWTSFIYLVTVGIITFVQTRKSRRLIASVDSLGNNM